MSIELLTHMILSHAPYQLPPVVHSGGVYALDIVYAGESFSKVSTNLEEVFTAYYRFVTKKSYLLNRKNAMAELPVRPGTQIPSQS
jgi:hypothetical protein